MPLLFAFDMDGVVYDHDWPGRMARLGDLTGIPAAEVARRWWSAGEAGAEAGEQPTGAAYLAAVNAALGTTVSAADFLAIRRAAMTVRPAVVAVVERAARLGRVTLLTNNGALVDEHLGELAVELVPIVGVENLRTSSRYGARKPDPAVFERMLASYRSAPADAFFVDDDAENVAGARSVGITGHHYTDPAALLAAVEAFAAARGAPGSGAGA